MPRVSRNARKDEGGFTAQLLKFTTRQNCLDFNLVNGINIALRPRRANKFRAHCFHRKYSAPVRRQVSEKKKKKMNSKN